MRVPRIEPAGAPGPPVPCSSMLEVSTHERLAPDDFDAVRALVGRVAAERGGRPLSDEHWLALTTQADGVVTAVIARTTDRVAGFGQASERPHPASAARRPAAKSDSAMFLRGAVFLKGAVFFRAGENVTIGCPWA